MKGWIGAIGPWVVAIVAIWGDKVRSWAFRPKLKIGLLDPRGEHAKQRISQIVEGKLQESEIETRWYHIRLTNESTARYPAAKETQVVLSRVEKPGPAGGPPQAIYEGALPLRWQHQETDPALRRTVGPEAVADLFFVNAKGFLYLTPIIIPYNFPGEHRGQTKLWVTLQARSVEVDSNALRVEIAWDGQWDRGEEEMAKHLQVTVPPLV